MVGGRLAASQACSPHPVLGAHTHSGLCTVAEQGLPGGNFLVLGKLGRTCGEFTSVFRVEPRRQRTSFLPTPWPLFLHPTCCLLQSPRPSRSKGPEFASREEAGYRWKLHSICPGAGERVGRFLRVRKSSSSSPEGAPLRCSEA